MPDLKVGLTTASFLPASALSFRSIDGILHCADVHGYPLVELLLTRAVRRNLPTARLDPWSHRIGSVHEVWNPRDALSREIARTFRGRPQCRGMTPYFMDSLFFANGAPSEDALLSLAERFSVPAVVSCLASPFSGRRYASRQAAVQVHPDLGPAGAHLELDAVSKAVEEQDYAVVLDTYHVRRRVRQHPGGRTEIAPPLAGPGESSLGGIARVWQRLGRRVTLVHFQPAHAAELQALLAHGALSDSLAELREILPACAERGIPVIVEVSPSLAAAARGIHGGPRMLPFLLSASAVRETIERVRDVLVRECARAATR